MRFLPAAAIVLISSSMALAQKPNQTRLYVPPAPKGAGAGAPSSPAAAQLARIEQSTAHLRSTRTVTHPTPGVKATPALDMGKNKTVHAGRSPHRANPKGH